MVLESERPVCTRPHLSADWTGTPPPRLMLGLPSPHSPPPDSSQIILRGITQIVSTVKIFIFYFFRK